MREAGWLYCTKAGCSAMDSIDAIAVTEGPGLAGALLVGIGYAKALAYGLGKPLIAVNHLEGHNPRSAARARRLRPHHRPAPRPGRSPAATLTYIWQSTATLSGTTATFGHTV